eukprot:COSAG06_NODE_2767_length_6315_cov_73.410071_2_plen_55_part_00
MWMNTLIMPASPTIIHSIPSHATTKCDGKLRPIRPIGRPEAQPLAGRGCHYGMI